MSIRPSKQLDSDGRGTIVLYSETRQKMPLSPKLTIDMDNTVIVELGHISFNDDKSSSECAFPLL